MELQDALFIFDEDGDENTPRDEERSLIVAERINWRQVGRNLRGKPLQVAQMYVRGYSPHTIARELQLSRHTVYEYLRAANYKLLVHLVAAEPCEQNAAVLGVQMARCGLLT